MKRKQSVVEKYMRELFFPFLGRECAELFRPKRDIRKSLRVFHLFKFVKT